MPDAIFFLRLVVRLDFALAESLSPTLRTYSGVNPSDITVETIQKLCESDCLSLEF